jgi:uncharacterized membrane protein
MRNFLIVCGAVVLSGCSTSAQEGAGKGATMGMVGGAVAGAVGSLLWGGNVVEGAAKGAAVGAASGAATGAVSGSMKDSAKKNEPKPKPAVDQAELRKKMGDRNYATTVLLTQCRHQDAIASAQDTLAASQSKDERVYALLIQGIAAEESGNKALASTAYSKIVQEDPARGNADKVRADALEGVMKVQATRRDHGLSPLCKA